MTARVHTTFFLLLLMVRMFMLHSQLLSMMRGFLNFNEISTIAAKITAIPEKERVLFLLKLQGTVSFHKF
jgi:hypothetical protein